MYLVIFGLTTIYGCDGFAEHLGSLLFDVVTLHFRDVLLVFGNLLRFRLRLRFGNKLFYGKFHFNGDLVADHWISWNLDGFGSGKNSFEDLLGC